jgi:hypothetical protein
MAPLYGRNRIHYKYIVPDIECTIILDTFFEDCKIKIAHT